MGLHSFLVMVTPRKENNLLLEHSARVIENLRFKIQDRELF